MTANPRSPNEIFNRTSHFLLCHIRLIFADARAKAIRDAGLIKVLRNYEASITYNILSNPLRDDYETVEYLLSELDPLHARLALIVSSRRNRRAKGR